MRNILLIIVLLSLTACTATPRQAENTSDTSSEKSSEQIVYTTNFERYTKANAGFSIDYPSRFEVNEDDELVTKDITIMGTAFVFPSSYSDRSTLLNAKIHIAKQLGQCMPAIFLNERKNIPINGRKYDVRGWSSEEAGNAYQGITYRTRTDTSCYILTLYAHSCNMGSACPFGRTKTFDMQPLIKIFDAMVKSFEIL